MKKVEKFGILFLIIIFIIAFFIFFRSKGWPTIFKSELDQFFGKGNWECISKEEKISDINYKHSPHPSDSISRRYTNWNIKFLNKYGNEEIWTITNLALKINNRIYGPFSSNSYSAKQALVLELKDIACGLASDDVLNDVISDELPENITDCLRVSIYHKNGNPKPKFYDELFKQPWFNVNDVTAENFLATDLYDFYIDIFAFDYKIEKLTEQERQVLFNSMENIERKLLQKYGENASFEIYFNDAHQVEYVNGIKQ